MMLEEIIIAYERMKKQRRGELTFHTLTLLLPF